MKESSNSRHTYIYGAAILDIETDRQQKKLYDFEWV